MKHKLKNITNRAIPLEGLDYAPESGEIVEVEMTARNEYLVKNKFYEDIGEVTTTDLKSHVAGIEEKEANNKQYKKVEEEKKNNYFEDKQSYKPHKKSRRSNKKNKN